MGVSKVIFGAVSIMDISDSTVTADKLAKDAIAYGADGERIVGTMEESADPVLQEKTVTPSTSAQAITPDSGYDGLSKVTVNAMQTATQATPSISVSNAGLITASATQSAGYVSEGTKSTTKQLTVQAAKTITPTESSQTAVASGRYTTGAVTVAAIPSNYENITASLADLNAANGGASATTMAAAVDNTEVLVSDENTLIEQAIAALEGKAGGSGSGGGGGTVDTCTLNVISQTALGYAIAACTVVDEDGNITAEKKQGTKFNPSITFNNVVCGSLVYYRGSTPFDKTHEESLALTNVEYVYEPSTYSTDICFKVTAEAGGTAVVERHS